MKHFTRLILLCVFASSFSALNAQQYQLQPGVSGGEGSFSQASPVIQSIVPANVNRGQTIALTITGQETHFNQATAATSMWLEQASTSTILTPAILDFDSDVQMTATFQFFAGEQTGLYSVFAQNSIDGTIEMNDGFYLNSYPLGIKTEDNPYGIAIYPNPVVDQLQISFDVTSPERISIRLYNVDGKLITVLNESDSYQGAYLHIVDVSGLPIEDGAFVVQCQIGSEVISKQIIKATK